MVIVDVENNEGGARGDVALSLSGGGHPLSPSPQKRTMGRTPADRPLKVNPKKGPGGGQLACADELAAFLACMMVRGVHIGRSASECRFDENRGATLSTPAVSSSFSLISPLLLTSHETKTSRMDAEGACAAPRKALDACAAAAASRTKGRSTINYHLQRLSRALRR